ncbi:M15 family metallopeptidase [Aeromonas hydrophila]|uniref:M15 family metallopeptidase n=1 Tax=Aeromonas hydrophila TaxID=644 RepID=UPI00235DCF5D|nr:M15 family metallopeptidase [Aeromonas hydrophila]
MTFKLSQKSLDRMSGVNPDLTKVVKRAIELTTVDFGITEGLRTVERQKQLVAEGKSQTMKSRHITGHAVDVVAYVDGKVSWEWKLYEQISKAFKQASADVGVPIEWGGDWKSLKDGPHFQLPVNRYPA